MRKSILVLSAGLAAMAASSLWLWGQWHHEREVNLELRARVEAAEQQDEHAPGDDQLVASSEVPPARAARATHNAAEAAVPVPVTAPMANHPDGFQQRLLKSPKFRQALRNQQRAALETRFRDLPKFLNLSPGEADQVFDLLAEQSVSLIELQQRGPWSPKEGLSRQDSHRELRQQNEAELSKLLGGANMNRFQEFRSTLQSRAEVGDVRSEMAGGPEPLREDQVEPMVKLVNSELQRMNQELIELAMSQEIPDAKRSELAIAANQRIVEAATPVLTSGQLSALKELYRRQRLQMETETELNRLRREAAISETQGAAPN